jgi:ABC-type glycerol-3-phosphate transport system substrate-binding protein
MFHDRPEVRAFMEYLTSGAQLENWIKSKVSFGFAPQKNARPEWFTNQRERAVAEVIVAAQKAGKLSNPDGYARWGRPEVGAQYFKSISDYINGDIDLDTALNQVDAVAASNATP